MSEAAWELCPVLPKGLPALLPAASSTLLFTPQTVLSSKRGCPRLTSVLGRAHP